MNKLDETSADKKCGIFFDGQIFDSYTFVADRIRESKSRVFRNSHDRFLIIDDKVYHFGASIKDLGKKWFAVNLMTEYTADELLRRL